MGENTKTMKVHQNIVINGVDYGDHKSRKSSKFCNEGKWNTFILPLLPKDSKDMTFIELGSNAGLYLRMAEDYGFHTVIGLENDPNAHSMAVQYRDSLRMKFTPILGTYSEQYPYDFPLADVTLLANFHYHLRMQDFPSLLNNLEWKTRYCIIVSVRNVNVHWMVDPKVEAVRRYFKDWKEVGFVSKSFKKDPHPRKGMYGICFESQLKRIPLVDLRRPDGKELQYSNAFSNFIRKTANHESFNMERNLYFRKVHHQKIKKMAYEDIQAYVIRRQNMILDIIEKGQKSPIIVNAENQVLDGGLRISVARALGYTSIIGRVL